MQSIKEAIRRARAAGDPVRRAPRAGPASGYVASYVPREGDLRLNDVPRTPLSRGHLESMRIVSADTNDPRSAAFDMLRTRVLRMMEENGWRTLAVTSPDPGCGKSVVSLNLAYSMARQPDRSVVLVDLDLRRPAIARYLGLQPELDIQATLMGEVALQDALVRPGLHDRERLVILLNRSPIGNASEVIASQEMRNLVLSLKGRDPSRIVIFDTAPVLTADDTVAFLPCVDCVLLVAAVGATRADSVEEADRQLSATNLLGVVLNKGREVVESYGY